jgi:hypothetical protein
VFEPGYLALALPKLNVMAVDKPPGPFHGLGIIGTDHFRRAEKNGRRFQRCKRDIPARRCSLEEGGSARLTVTDDCPGEAVIGPVSVGEFNLSVRPRTPEIE